MERTGTTKRISELPVRLERDVFLRTLLRHLSGTLQDVVGFDEAAGFVSVVGQKIGDEINDEYRAQLQTRHLSKEQVGAVLVDLKKRIQGDFYFTLSSRPTKRSCWETASARSRTKSSNGRPLHDDLQRFRRHCRRELRLRQGRH